MLISLGHEVQFKLILDSTDTGFRMQDNGFVDPFTRLPVYQIESRLEAAPTTASNPMNPTNPTNSMNAFLSLDPWTP
jgi:hypothetical protein